MKRSSLFISSAVFIGCIILWLAALYIWSPSSVDGMTKTVVLPERPASAQPLRGRARYYDNYSRPDIVNSTNIDQHAEQFQKPQYVAPNREVDEPDVMARLLNLVLSMSYQPGAMSPGHRGLAGNCQACHSFFNEDFRDSCLGCHTALQAKMNSKKGFHFNVRMTDCRSCHLEHAYGQINFVPIGGFQHTATDYQLQGYHTLADCYYCHRQASIIQPNTVISFNTQPRDYLRFSIEKNRCQDCHPDPHVPSFGKTCQKCHPVNLRWYQ